ncbi:potassium channel family protein [Cohnella sp. AR92]|uniref:potassium channel family protein n=1 Tax=Cohnella sp. AR92 TaxID=648716 RepID=UPI000F8D5548|nr:potassium channel family protein [Cohnella sp. AR92]RUS47604.1 two pore domain potassium channel family protein [Cohnella sp. AR92]
MVSFILTLKRMLTGLWHSFKDKRFRNLFLTTLLMLLSGTLFYHEVEHFSYLDALYFSVMTLTTVGAGDLAPETAFGKIFTMIYTLAGIGIVFGVIFFVGRGIHFSKNPREEKDSAKKNSKMAKASEDQPDKPKPRSKE